MAGITSSIGRKYAMALSAMFLLIFLVMHLSTNMISVFSEDVSMQHLILWDTILRSVCDAACLILQ
jgi:hypothetical protein